MSKGRSIKICNNIRWREIAGRMVILNQKNNNRYILSEIGMLVWNYITDSKSLQNAIDFISKEYSMNRDKVAYDMDIFLQNLEKENIISLKIIEQ